MQRPTRERKLPARLRDAQENADDERSVKEVQRLIDLRIRNKDRARKASTRATNDNREGYIFYHYFNFHYSEAVSLHYHR